MVAYEGRREKGENIVERVDGEERTLLENHADVIGLEDVGFKWNRKGDPACQALAASLLMDVVHDEEIVRCRYESVARRLPHYINGLDSMGRPLQRQGEEWRFSDKAIRYFALLRFDGGSSKASTKEESTSVSSKDSSIEALGFPQLDES